MRVLIALQHWQRWVELLQITISLQSPIVYRLDPLTYTYLDYLLGVKMRGHKVAKI